MTFLARMRAQIRQASQEQAPEREEDPLEEARWEEREAEERAQDERRVARRARKTARDHIREAHQAERLDRYQQILQLAAQGLSSTDSAARVGLSGRTVRQWVAEGIKTSPRRRRPSPLDSYASYLQKRWEEGEQRGVKLYQELAAKRIYWLRARDPSVVFVGGVPLEQMKTRLVRETIDHERWPLLQGHSTSARQNKQSGCTCALLRN